MTRREKGLTGLVVIALLGAVALVWWVLSPDEAEAPALDDAEAELAQWGLPEPPPVRSEQGEPEAETPRGEAEAPERAERRRRWLARWRRSVEIVPLGPSEATLDADQIRAALRAGRPALRDCIRESGGWRALREARRAERRAARETAEAAGEAPPEQGGRRRRPRRRVRFDVGADGTVDPASIEFEPAMPEAFDACFRAYFSSPELLGAGPDGAAVELPMGGRRRRRRSFDGDAGVGGWGERRRRRRQERRREGRAEEPDRREERPPREGTEGR